jgi:hypothetical protein
LTSFQNQYNRPRAPHRADGLDQPAAEVIELPVAGLAPALEESLDGLHDAVGVAVDVILLLLIISSPQVFPGRQDQDSADFFIVVPTEVFQVAGQEAIGFGVDGRLENGLVFFRKFNSFWQFYLGHGLLHLHFFGQLFKPLKLFPGIQVDPRFGKGIAGGDKRYSLEVPQL